MTKEDSALNFSGLTHDHTTLGCHLQANNSQTDSTASDESCSTIAILRRHPMYDCLVLVKKYRSCLEGHSLEFPLEAIQTNSTQTQTAASESRKNSVVAQSSSSEIATENTTTVKAPAAITKECGRRQLVSRFFDGDDPMYQSICISCRSIGSRAQSETNIAKNSASQAGRDSSSAADQAGTNSSKLQAASSLSAKGSTSLTLPFAQQFDDNGDLCELVHVPINGLLDRLKNYTESGVAVDSRVYAFAMGLKTSERILTTSSMKELQETPI